MGQYKVPQDVEAEDKIIGGLTLKQFLYAVIGVVYGLVTFELFKAVPVLFVVIGIPPTLLMITLGLYKRQDQPFEALFVALVAFLTRPRKLVWEKEPIEEVFKIEPPKVKPQAARRDPAEVRGELEKLARIVDTRGWSAKQPELQEPVVERTQLDSEDRLGGAELLQTAVPAEAGDITVQDDILDFEHNPTAQNLDALIDTAVQHVREVAVQKMQHPRSDAAQAIIKAQAPEAKAASPAPAQTSAHSQSTSDMTPNPIAGILKQAMENTDLTVSQIAAQANKQGPLPEGQSVNLRNASH